mmetsp:Transcript_4894/g.14595  ORF Transcript_4894/g.14595 Transcript_4894/m.14595 type:complete len:180 (-) Transcript_4894:199-738(-)
MSVYVLDAARSRNVPVPRAEGDRCGGVADADLRDAAGGDIARAVVEERVLPALPGAERPPGDGLCLCAEGDARVCPLNAGEREGLPPPLPAPTAAAPAAARMAGSPSWGFSDPDPVGVRMPPPPFPTLSSSSSTDPIFTLPADDGRDARAGEVGVEALRRLLVTPGAPSPPIFLLGGIR